MSGICYIFGAGDFGDMEGTFEEEMTIERTEGDLVIAADGGLQYLQEIGIKPDVIVGDFDSAVGIPKDDEADVVVRLPVEKDVTDIHAALRIGIERGYDQFEIYGALGGERLDHSVGNIQLGIWLAKQGMHGTFYGDRTFMTVIRNEEYAHEAVLRKWIVSVFCAGEQARGVTIQGMKYGIEDYVLTNDFPLGISNETLPGQDFTVSVEEGILVIIGHS